MKIVMNEYEKKRIAFFALHPTCQAKLTNCTGMATDIHHKAGRGENHNNINTWMAVCRSCHQWIEEHPNDAKVLGFSQSRLN